MDTGNALLVSRMVLIANIVLMMILKNYSKIKGKLPLNLDMRRQRMSVHNSSSAFCWYHPFADKPTNNTSY